MYSTELSKKFPVGHLGTVRDCMVVCTSLHLALALFSLCIGDQHWEGAFYFAPSGSPFHLSTDIVDMFILD